MTDAVNALTGPPAGPVSRYWESNDPAGDAQWIREVLPGRQLQVADGGSVQLLAVDGTDAEICRAARSRYGLFSWLEGRNATVLRRLLRRGATTPFEQASLQLLIRMPADVWLDHCQLSPTSADQYVTRDSYRGAEMPTTRPEDWRSAALEVAQPPGPPIADWPPGYVPQVIDGEAPYVLTPELAGMPGDTRVPLPAPRAPQLGDAKISGAAEISGAGRLTPGAFLSERERLLQAHAQAVYAERVLFGVATAQARKDLPACTYKEFVWTVDLYTLLRYLEKALHATTPLALQQYGQVIARELVWRLFPCVWRAFEDFRLQRVALSWPEQELLRKLVQAGDLPASLTAAQLAAQRVAAWQDWRSRLPLTNCDERDEALLKLQRLGLIKGAGDD